MNAASQFSGELLSFVPWEKLYRGMKVISAKGTKGEITNLYNPGNVRLGYVFKKRGVEITWGDGEAYGTPLNSLFGVTVE